MTHKRHHRPPMAYTLMEMVLVLTIISLLLGFGIYKIVGAVGGGEKVAARADVSMLVTSLLSYRNDALMLPTQDQGLRALVERPTTDPKPKVWGKKVKDLEALNDPWGRPYIYRNPGSKSADGFDVFTLGQDGEEGTEDDIGNW